MVDDEDVGTVMVEGMGVNKFNPAVGIWPGLIGAAGLPASGVDAASVASRSEGWAGGVPPKLQARSTSSSPLHK
jgi:hypothetical protein